MAHGVDPVAGGTQGQRGQADEHAAGADGLPCEPRRDCRRGVGETGNNTRALALYVGKHLTVVGQWCLF